MSDAAQGEGGAQACPKLMDFARSSRLSRTVGAEKRLAGSTREMNDEAISVGSQ
jgi:hypothetical protein